MAGGFTVAATARLAALFGAGRPGRVLAALIAACAPFTLPLAHFGDTSAYDVLAWTLVLLCASTALTPMPRRKVLFPAMFGPLTIIS